MGLYSLFWHIDEANHVSRGPPTELDARRWGFALNRSSTPISRSRTRFSALPGPFFQKDRDFSPNPFSVNFRADLGLQGQKVVVAASLFLFRDIIFKPAKSIGARPRGVFKDEVVFEPHFLQKGPRGFVIGFGFSTEAHDDVPSQNHIREDFSSSSREIQEGLAVVSRFIRANTSLEPLWAGAWRYRHSRMLGDRVQDVVAEIPR